jgi:RNA polymerase sigma-70 factor (ECF subfamily)
MSNETLTPTSDTIRQWVDEHADYLYSYALSRVRNEYFAEEVVQETFIAAAKAIDSFKGDSTVKTWLTGILKHKLIDALRKEGRQRLVFYDELDIDSLSSHFDQSDHWSANKAHNLWGQEPDKLIEQSQFMGALEDCTDALPERLRSAFVMREVDGHSTDDLCDSLGISSNNLWVMLHRARMKLRDCLDANWFAKSEA